MGLISAVVLAPLLPVRGVVWVADAVAAEAARAQQDMVRAELAGLEAALEAGEIDEETFDAAEDALWARLGHQDSQEG